MIKKIFAAASVSLFLASGHVLAEPGAETEAQKKAAELMKAGKPLEAYKLLEPFEFEQAGNIDYDYLLGIAALDSGNPAKATFIFERVLISNPNHAGARLDMARAYFQLGDYVRARREFAIVLSQNPPPQAKAAVDKYLEAIELAEKAKATTLTGYFEAFGGRNSNINNSTGQAQVTVPGIGNLSFNLAATNLKLADNYLGAAVGGDVNHIINETYSVFAGIDLRQRSFSTDTIYDKTQVPGVGLVDTSFRKSVYDSLNIDGRAGVSVALSVIDSLKFSISAGNYTLGHVHNRDSLGYNAEWDHAFDAANQMVVFSQLIQQRYVIMPFALDPKTPLNAPSDPRAGNTDQAMFGATGVHILADGKSALFGGIYGGKELSEAPATPLQAAGWRADGKKNFIGVKFGGQASVNDKTEIFASGGVQRGDYGTVNTLFGVTRADELQDFSVGANWHWDDRWTVRPQISMQRNKSNIALYRYDMTDVSLTLRRDFR